MSNTIDPTGGGALNVDFEQVKQSNLAAINGLGEGAKTEYWVGKTTTSPVTWLLVVGRNHDPLVYQALQTMEVECSGWLELYQGRVYAPNVEFWARTELEKIEGDTTLGDINYFEPTRVNFSTIAPLNRAHLKATADGMSVPYKVVYDRQTGYLLVGDGHEPGLHEMGDGSSGVIWIKKGRLFNAGKLNVIDASKDEHALITAQLGDISDKEVVFDEGDDDAADET